MLLRSTLLLGGLLLLPACSRVVGEPVASPPAWQVDRGDSDAIAVLARQADSGSPRVFAAVWLRMPTGSGGLASSSGGEAFSTPRSSLAKFELRAEFGRTGLAPLTLLAKYTEDDSPRAARVTLQLGAQSFDPSAGRLLLIDARGDKARVIQLAATVDLDSLSAEALAAWLRERAVKHPEAAAWR